MITPMNDEYTMWPFSPKKSDLIIKNQKNQSLSSSHLLLSSYLLQNTFDYFKLSDLSSRSHYAPFNHYVCLNRYAGSSYTHTVDRFSRACQASLWKQSPSASSLWTRLFQGMNYNFAFSDKKSHIFSNDILTDISALANVSHATSSVMHEDFDFFQNINGGS